MVTPFNSQKGKRIMLTLQIIAIILWTIALVFTILTFCQLLPKKEKEEPINKFPYANVTIQFESDDVIYTLYDDGTWEVDVNY